MADDVQRTLVFFVNGTKVEDPKVDPEWTLLYYLRNKLRLCGTKLGCSEGGCGACTVMVSRYDVDDGTIIHYSLNACLAPVASMHGIAVTTVEGIGSTKSGLHAVQERLAKAHGSQCGFCTPGMVMSMYTLLRNNPVPSMAQIKEYMAGNLCRCTGYRPILDGFKTFTSDEQRKGCGRSDCCQLNGQKTESDALNGSCNGSTTKNSKTEANENSSSYIESDISDALHDVSEFKPYDPTQEIIFPPELKLHKEWQKQELELCGPRVKFYKPSTLDKLLQLKRLYPDAKIIVGNTEVGVEVKFKNQLYSVLINPSNIPELKSFSVKASGVCFGASVTITTVEDVLREQIKSQPEYTTRTFAAILEMLRWFSGKQIRNVAAMGGNIMTGSPISDLNPLLMAAGATLTLRSKERGDRQVVFDHQFFVGYRKNIAMPDEILLYVHIPYTQKDEYFFGYKQSRRREDDIAIVNAGMKVIFEPESSVVKQLYLAFGGMAPTTVMATTTMKALVGKKWDRSLLEAGTDQILKDLPLLPSAPGGMVEYRKALTVSFFFKFYLSVRECLSRKLVEGVESLTPEEQKAIELYQYQVPKSTQIFQKVPSSQSSLDPIGKPIVHATALQQTTGEAVYVDDIPVLENELYAGFVLSDRAHAKIISIDESEALKVEGVRRFFCARDVPSERNIIGLFNDEEMFASKKVTSIGQLVGMIVAKDRITAQRAAKLVKVQYEDIKPIILTAEDAIREKSFFGQWTMSQGDPESSFKDSKNILEGEIYIGGQEHFYLETQVALAVPKGEDNEMDIYASTQNPTSLQVFAAKCLGVPQSRVVCHVKRIGGGFGGKNTRTFPVALPLCIAASQMNCPIRIVLDRDEDMAMTGGRHPALCRWKVGFSDNGTLLALNVDLYICGGYSIDVSNSVLHKALFTFENTYRCPNIKITGYSCKTNLPSNTAARGFGVPQAMLCMEDIMSRISAFLDIEPTLVRGKNLLKSGDRILCSMILEACTIARCWDEVLEKSNYHLKRAAVDKFNRENSYRKRGLAATPMTFPIPYSIPVRNQAGALVLVYVDGSVLLSHGGTEMGQGLHTKMIQVASRVLRIPYDKIHVAETSTNKVPNTSSTSGSTGSDLNGMAVKDACEKIMQRLEPFMAQNPKGTWKDWVKAAYMERVSLSASGFYQNPNVKEYDFGKQEGHPCDYFVYGAAVTEVEIDCLTGSHTVLSTDMVVDIGESLNPAIDIGQLEGAFMNGLGLVTLEELYYTPQGVLLSKGPGTYKIPGFQDIPKEFNVSLLRGAPNPRAVYSSKAVGEPTFVLATSVLYSIKDAISSARADAGLERVFRFDSPATAERIRMACPDFITNKVDVSEPGSYEPWCVKI